MGEEKKHKPALLKMLEETEQNIIKYGVQVYDIFGTDYSPPFAYSIGLFETYGHPEIICFGLPEKLCGQIVHDVAKLIKDGKRFHAGDITLEIFKNSEAVFLAVDERNIGDYLLHATAYYGDEKFNALQLVWADRNDKFP
ncbi:DUF4262 domain-containing protein [Mucilaginibacter myungsuensis]|uniref:DUF4262 domain-containing protein n=1 Tax=Mucilaginibacter myungsuensis TaxID=649104 RepID=UPI001D15ECDA|nr:DUF4262 domain-containing protein [Mucilaginibacter myungsuensis]MDN3600095.1 DUF4262 domain-containing protein [Mucilaginibacter myungsuensis]